MDRLVEFGLGMSVARQMVKMMEETMANTTVPPSPQPLKPNAVYVSQVNPIVPSPSFYIAINEKSAGPFTESELAKLIMNGQIDKNTLSWMPGMTEWKKVEDVPEILKIVALTPPPLNP